jgi:hypothetical protein
MNLVVVYSELERKIKEMKGQLLDDCMRLEKIEKRIAELEQKTPGKSIHGILYKGKK